MQQPYIRDDSEMLAFAYTAPISALIHLCDREPEKTQEAMAQVEAFSRHFKKTMGMEKNAMKWYMDRKRKLIENRKRIT